MQQPFGQPFGTAQQFGPPFGAPAQQDFFASSFGGPAAGAGGGPGGLTISTGAPPHNPAGAGGWDVDFSNEPPLLEGASAAGARRAC